MAFLDEQAVEGLLLEAFVALGYEHQSDSIIGPDGECAERTSHGDVILLGRMKAAVARLNPYLPEPVRDEAIRKLTLVERPSLLEENRRLHRALTEGEKVEHRDADGRTSYPAVRLIDFEDPENNDWLVVDQFTVVENGHKRRPDVVVFVNGLPLAVVELKNPTSEQATLKSAFNQLQTYKHEIPALFRTNAALVITDGMRARVGSLTANEERFMPWRTVYGEAVLPAGAPEADTLIQGVFDKRRFLELVRDFTLFLNTGSGVVKILAGYHQYHAVKHAVAKTIEATAPGGDRRIGVIWHTQGSGKSLLMAFYAGQLVKHPALENPTVVVITDRNDLDDQLYGTFAGAQDLIRQAPVQADSREDLQKALNRAAGGVVFTTIQKFAPPASESDYPALTKRRNVIVIADEAHRSQYGFRARVEQRTGDIGYGFAKYMRDALPNASFIGFTGTPIEKDDVNTPAVFGEYIDIYDISRAVEDGATVPIYYESRLARIELPEDEKPTVDAEIEALTEGEELSDAERLKQKWATVEALVGSKKRLELVAKDLVEHFEQRVMSLDGKAMVVAMSRRICVALYDEIVKLRPHWHDEDPNKGVIKVVEIATAVRRSVCIHVPTVARMPST
jgi:type I restriction enzyme R subunit